LYFITIRQIWDFLNVVVEKPPHGALEESLRLLNKNQPLLDGNSEGLLKRHSQLRAVCEGAKLSGTLPTLFLPELLQITDSIIKNMSAKEQAVFQAVPAATLKKISVCTNTYLYNVRATCTNKD
jgi:hypothetical protein